jgi:hypothetical protein
MVLTVVEGRIPGFINEGGNLDFKKVKGDK